MIEVKCEPAQRLIVAHMSGFLSLDEVAQFSREEQALVEAAGIEDEFYLLVDTSESIIQMQEVAVAFQRLITDSKHKARRIAIVRQTSLSRMQTERIVRIRDDAAIFGTRDDAEHWLFTGDAAAAA